MSYYVYLLRDPRKNLMPFYVGKGTGERYNHWRWRNKEWNNIFLRRTIEAILAAGLEPVAEIVVDDLDEVDALNIERSFILVYGRRGLDPAGVLCNRRFDSGGRSEWLTDESKAKISASLKGRKHDPERVQHRVDVRRQKGNFVASDETRAKIADTLRGTMIPANVREKISQSLRGREFSDEHRQNLAKAFKGFTREQLEKGWEKRRGRKTGPRSEETRRKISEGRKRYFERKKAEEAAGE